MSKEEMSLLSIARITAWVRRKVSRAWSGLTLRRSGSELATVAGDACRSRRELIIENAVLRHELNVLRRRVKRPVLHLVDRVPANDKTDHVDIAKPIVVRSVLGGLHVDYRRAA